MTKEDRHETRKRILKAAKSEFAEFGYDGARMGAIAKRANANQALLHYYFKTKDKLYEEILQHYLFIDDEALIRERVANWVLSMEEALFMGIYLLVNFTLETLDPEMNRIMSREVAEGRSHQKNIMNNYILPRMKSFQEVIQHGIDTGVFETINAHMVVMQLVVFIISYNNIKVSELENANSTNQGIENSTDDDKEEIFRFLLEHTVKGLTPVGKIVTIPEFSKERMDTLKLLINEIREMRIGDLIGVD